MIESSTKWRIPIPLKRVKLRPILTPWAPAALDFPFVFFLEKGGWISRRILPLRPEIPWGSGLQCMEYFCIINSNLPKRIRAVSS